jgi:glycine/D-amino acid oxidase-like deaminating enzyme
VHACTLTFTKMEFEHQNIYDCIVVGIGGHGSSIVANLAKAGKRVLGLEQFPPVHNKGKSLPGLPKPNLKGFHLNCYFSLNVMCAIRFFSWTHQNLSPSVF